MEADGREPTQRIGKKNVNKRAKLDCKMPKPACVKCRLNCSESFTDLDRIRLCKDYNNLDSYARKKEFLLSMVVKKKNRVRVRGGSDNRQKERAVSIDYFFAKDSKRVQVCKKFFMGTLAIGHSPIHEAVKGCGESGQFAGMDKRGIHTPANKTKEKDMAVVREHIESFPRTPSHYTRKDTKREYLAANLTIQKMYDLYQEECKSKTLKPVSCAIYRRIFGTEYNLSFFKPKKDQCELCTKYSEADVERKMQMVAEYNEHVKRKEECQQAKAVDKSEASEKANVAIATFDLQSVLSVPCSQVSCMYYSRKLNTYNLTIYSLKAPNHAVCYCWSETDGKIGSNETGTCLFKWLKNLPSAVDEVILYSDTCGGQNRNRHIAALLLHAVQTTHLKVIQQKFLERGHTYMEVDSMHSATEFAKQNVPVYSPRDWQNIFRSARKRNPYEVCPLDYSEFLDLKHMSRSLVRTTASDEGPVQWLKVKCLKFEREKPGVIQFRYGHSGEYKSVNVFGRGRPPKFTPVNVYKSQIPITKAKYNDLMKLCSKGVIPVELHAWYAQLPTSATATDVTVEPGVEDTGDESDD